MKSLLPGLILACSSAFAAAPVTVEYAHPGGVSLKLDACVPDGAGPFPAVILIHGGGWNSGDRTGGTRRALIAPMEDPLTAAGYAWFSIDYRLVPHATWPDPLDDVNAAIRWVKAHAGEYRVDPSRIAISGESAGGHLALIAAVTAAADTRPAAAVIFYGPWDLTDQYHFHGDKMGAGMGGLFGSQVFDAPTVAKLKAASPMTYVRPGLPPILLVHGDKDVQVRYELDPVYQAKLRALGDTCDLITIHGGPHGMIYWDKFDPNYKAEVVAWLNQHLPKRP
ncbi:MAG TPA: alpha/beta hydrolase [Opitutaceae bacterium]|nr:alpha/beta hydrolase [Opitutaceae bacterium]